MYRLGRHLRREWLSLILGTVLVLLGGNAIFGPQGPRDLLALRARRAELEAVRTRLAAQNAALASTAQKLGSDDSYIERAIRRELGYARPNELIYKFPTASDSSR